MGLRLPRFEHISDRVICKETLLHFLRVWSGLINAEKLGAEVKKKLKSSDYKLEELF